jgi:hypothetical protein
MLWSKNELAGRGVSLVTIMRVDVNEIGRSGPAAGIALCLAQPRYCSNRQNFSMTGRNAAPAQILPAAIGDSAGSNYDIHPRILTTKAR